LKLKKEKKINKRKMKRKIIENFREEE